eukprot:CAMPEP_0115138666 /NCGR_PEP_ID=MMETSP0227-20121206/57807_1 /TAXON_ID=89957 /ORGANISM="Polarella glacialis, Strain CCMP 1383" /LENGTH=115 /DNA_ID=CAMNT_0002546339 /DNA_START=239 /DNA_END=583 /DNA_ORIENTATION=+
MSSSSGSPTALPTEAAFDAATQMRRASGNADNAQRVATTSAQGVPMSGAVRAVTRSPVKKILLQTPPLKTRLSHFIPVAQAAVVAADRRSQAPSRGASRGWSAAWRNWSWSDTDG